MKRDRDQPADGSSLPLFDLPLHGDPDEAPPSEPASRQTDEVTAAPGSGGAEPAIARSQDAPASQSDEGVPAPRTALFAVDDAEERTVPGPGDGLSPRGDRVPLGARLASGVADLTAIFSAVAVGAGAARLLGVRITLASWPTLVLLAVPFSFLYSVIPLAFWGQTPGMAWAGIAAQAHDGEPLSFQQTALRWLGGLVTVALAGLPLLVSLSGASLADRVSRSITFAVDDA